MANTHTTNKQRLARIHSRKERSLSGFQVLTPEEGVERDAALRAIQGLQVNGTRYGNHRKMYAKEKRKARQQQRRVLNREVKIQLVED